MSSRGEEFRVDGRNARKLLEPEELRRFTVLDDRKSLLAQFQTFFLLAAFVALGLWAWQMAAARDGMLARAGWIALIALCVVVLGILQQALFVLSHEAAHYRLMRSRRWNDLLGRIAATPGGISMCTYRVTHRLHHNHLYGPQDPDMALNAGYPRGKAYLFRKMLTDLSGWTAPKTYAYFFGAPAINSEQGDRINPLNDTSESLRRDARRDRWVVVACHVIVPAVILATWGPGALLKYFALWVLPLLTVLQVILRLRAVAEHGAPAGYESPLHASRTNLAGDGLSGWLLHRAFFPHHVNYHIEHHLYPAIPQYHLKAAHQALLDKGALEGAEVRKLPETLARIFQPRGSIPEAIQPKPKLTQQAS